MEGDDDEKADMDKMLAGELYNSQGPLLRSMRAKAKEICRDFNTKTEDEDLPGREKLLKSEEEEEERRRNQPIEPPLRVDYGCFMKVGKNFYANYDFVVLDCGWVTIGDDCLFGPGVHLYAAGHPTDPSLRLSGLEFGKPVSIGHRVWLGGKVIVLPGVSIGDDSVIGAGSVVTKDIPPGVVAAGNPCKVIKKVG